MATRKPSLMKKVQRTVKTVKKLSKLPLLPPTGKPDGLVLKKRKRRK